MPFDFHRARPLLHSGNLAKLFVEELGWEPCRQILTLRAGETDYAFTAVAEKRGFTAWLITILDPTGGSGAFIFAALNILEPLYEACLDRMEAFLAEWGENGSKSHPNYHRKFAEVLARVDAHPNRRYFVLKSIILNNLYAVDIMEEAVEICKLRLFLKLAAQVEPDSEADNLGIEPLPDIDFNIRAGNTLVGYATKQEVQRCMKEVGGGQMTLMDEADLGSFARFNTRCADVEQAFAKFRQLQSEGDGSVPHACDSSSAPTPRRN